MGKTHHYRSISQSTPPPPPLHSTPPIPIILMLAINLKNARVLTNLFYKRFNKRSYKQDFIKSIFTVKVAFRKSIPNLGSGTPTQSEFDYIQCRAKLVSPHSDGFLTVTSLAPKRKVPQKRQEDFPAAGDPLLSRWSAFELQFRGQLQSSFPSEILSTARSFWFDSAFLPYSFRRCCSCEWNFGRSKYR